MPVVRATDLGSVQVLKHGVRYLLTDAFGDIHPDTRGLGLYEGDTRLLSVCIVRVGGERPVLLQASIGANYRGGIQLTNPSVDRNPDAKVNPLDELVGRTVGISRSRLIGDHGVEERLRIVNHGAHVLRIPVELGLGMDGADIFEVRGYPRPDRGHLLPVAVMDRRVTFRYDGLDGVRRLVHVALSKAPDRVGPGTEPAVAADGTVRPDDGATIRLGWDLSMGPGEQRDLSWTFWSTKIPVEADPDGQADGPEDDAAELFPTEPTISDDDGADAYREWERVTTTVASDHELFNLVIKRSVSDLRLLMNDGPGPGQRYVAAGVPWFVTLFGRDAIITAIQSLAAHPRLAVETLTVLAAYQATETDPWRDAEPGKILHELRTGEMAGAGELPHTPYYGSVDSTPLWLILLGATFDWTGDRALVDRLWPNALAALDWIDRHGDMDGDGFVEYQRHSERGLLNQGWKDSSDAIRDRSGREVVGPIALVEVQGYVYDAKRRMAGLARIRGDEALATRLESDAETLRARFEAAFWVDDQHYYAMALDGQKRPADAIASNPGHGLWTGIVSPDRARDVIDRLLRPDMFSGWGVRTYASGQPGYNPIGYHTGSVWPHDTAIIAAGLKRYGFHEASNRLAGQMLDAAQRFPDHRLPELFCGFDSAESPAPVPYPVACSPQAWSAGSSFLFLEAMLGLRAHAAGRELELSHPHLPDWLTKVTLTDLRIGEASVDLLFHRWRGTTSAEVLRKDGDLAVTIRL
ncbi:MAG: glycogen debranching N-terminal domain-containing protein [Chloroflexota bacterium]